MDRNRVLFYIRLGASSYLMFAMLACFEPPAKGDCADSYASVMLAARSCMPGVLWLPTIMMWYEVIIYHMVL